MNTLINCQSKVAEKGPEPCETPSVNLSWQKVAPRGLNYYRCMPHMLFMTAMVRLVKMCQVFTAGIPVAIGLLNSQPQLSTSWWRYRKNEGDNWCQQNSSSGDLECQSSQQLLWCFRSVLQWWWISEQNTCQHESFACLTLLAHFKFCSFFCCYHKLTDTEAQLHRLQSSAYRLSLYKCVFL